jgi:hypothetical protein
MQATTRRAIGSDESAAGAAPGPLPKPPGRPPAEPIVIRTPPRPRDGPEIEESDEEDEEGGGEIRRPPPGRVPDLPPPPRPEERAAAAVKDGRAGRGASASPLPEKRPRPEGFRP